jgi:hypothetical protein
MSVLTASGHIYRSRSLFDYRFSGSKKLSSDQTGVTLFMDSAGTEAAPATMMIFEASSFTLAFMLESAADGSWVQLNVNGDFEYTVVARDLKKVHNSAIFDWLAPVDMD